MEPENFQESKRRRRGPLGRPLGRGALLISAAGRTWGWIWLRAAATTAIWGRGRFGCGRRRRRRRSRARGVGGAGAQQSPAAETGEGSGGSRARADEKGGPVLERWASTLSKLPAEIMTSTVSVKDDKEELLYPTGGQD
nr:uncharacterized protein LOC127309963 [Lolium perenne]